MKQPAHGGPREGAGAPPKDPKAGNRVPFSSRLHPDTVELLPKVAKKGKHAGQGEAIDEAVKRYARELGL